MPVILQPKDYDLWLDPDVQDASLLEPLLRPYPSDEMEVYRVSRLVNDPRHEDPKCVEPQEEPGKYLKKFRRGVSVLISQVLWPRHNGDLAAPPCGA
jgi:hypothetical protein